jgi:glycerophosphoryl diester phosphodiesterase
MSNNTQIWALSGESLSAPEDTIPAYWGALACGAHGLVVGVQMTADDVVVCCERDTLEATCGDPRAVGDVTWKELRKLDAGSQFRSTVLDRSWQPAGQGDDTPWEGPSRKQYPLYHPSLDELLLLFGRRAPLLLKLVVPSDAAADARRLVDGVMHLLFRLGLAERVIVAGDAKSLRLVRKASKATPLALVAGSQSPAAAALGAVHVMIDAEKIVSGTGRVAAGLTAALGRKVTVLVTSTEMPFVLSPTYYVALAGKAWLAGIVTRGVLVTRDMDTPPALIVEDDFAGKEVNRSYWTMGYSKANQDTKISQSDGLVIQIKKGGEYSGAAALTSYPIRGDFDAQITFEVKSPQQGTTFELAAIQVDPGYHHMSNTDLDRRSVNLTFDVHGAPPYASSERDESDGFRIGWNNGPAVTQFVQYTAQSSNIYNKYSRDVGDGSASNPNGRLRLVRHGDVFAAFYTDKHNEAWVLCGTAMVPTLCQEVFLRLGAKHWPKRGKTPPPNRFRFSNFRLWQW